LNKKFLPDKHLNVIFILDGKGLDTISQYFSPINISFSQSFTAVRKHKKKNILHRKTVVKYEESTGNCKVKPLQNLIQKSDTGTFFKK
jgi:hypothetical protein